MSDKAISMGTLAKLKQKAAGARRRVSTKREALGQTNERGGPDSPRESLGAVPHIEPVKKKGFLAKMKGLLTRGKSKSGRSSKGERKKSLAEESITKLNLSAESTSAPRRRATARRAARLRRAGAEQRLDRGHAPLQGQLRRGGGGRGAGAGDGVRHAAVHGHGRRGAERAAARHAALRRDRGRRRDGARRRGVSLDEKFALTPELTAKVAESFEKSRAALDQKAKLAAAAWILGKRFGPEQARAPCARSAPAPAAAAPAAVAAAAAALAQPAQPTQSLTPPPPSLRADGDAGAGGRGRAGRERELRRRRARVGAVGVRGAVARARARCFCGDEELRAAEGAAEDWVSKLAEAQQVVIDPNMSALLEHLGDAARAARECRVRDGAEPHADRGAAQGGVGPQDFDGGTLSRRRHRHRHHHHHHHHHHLHHSFHHRHHLQALDDVEGQFVGGMQQVAVPLLGGVPASDVATLCAAAVRAHRRKLDLEYDIPKLATSLEEMLEKQAELSFSLNGTAGAGAPAGAVATPETEPLSWLYGIVIGSIPLPLDEDDWTFLSRGIAEYLDPFIDGEVPAAQYKKRSDGFVTERLRKAWEARQAVFAKAERRAWPYAPEVVLAQYVRHCITKMNANLGWGVHIPGMGRQPVSPLEQERHFKLLGLRLVEAIERDFTPAQRRVGELTAIPANALSEISSTHMKGSYMYANELANALAAANRDGEEARREERLRIWGYA